MVCIGTLALALALLNISNLSGLAFVLVAPVQTVLGTIHGRRRAAISAQMAAERGAPVTWLPNAGSADRVVSAGRVTGPDDLS